MSLCWLLAEEFERVGSLAISAFSAAFTPPARLWCGGLCRVCAVSPRRGAPGQRIGHGTKRFERHDHRRVEATSRAALRVSDSSIGSFLARRTPDLAHVSAVQAHAPAHELRGTRGRTQQFLHGPELFVGPSRRLGHLALYPVHEGHRLFLPTVIRTRQLVLLKRHALGYVSVLHCGDAMGYWLLPSSIGRSALVRVQTGLGVDPLTPVTVHLGLIRGEGV